MSFGQIDPVNFCQKQNSHKFVWVWSPKIFLPFKNLINQIFFSNNVNFEKSITESKSIISVNCLAIF